VKKYNADVMATHRPPVDQSSWTRSRWPFSI